MGDLISRSALIKQLLEAKDDEIIKAVIGLVQTQPTAYDVNEVIRKLEKIKGHYGYYGSEECEYVPYEDAIDIVKGGVE